METPFPFGLPFPTAFYLTLYVFTLVIHVIFMNYVIAGTGYLAGVGLFANRKKQDGRSDPLGWILRDWMPFALGATITAGVAPLLFLQILYRKRFYTANLLLFHRWMAILPALIVGFYMLYLLKSKRLADRPAVVQISVGGVAFLCFAFTGYSWTENYLLSMQSQEFWSHFYASGQMLYPTTDVLPRLLFWFSGSIATMATITAWQVRGTLRSNVSAPALHTQSRRFAILALGGIALSLASGRLYYLTAGDAVREQLTGALAAPYLYAAMGGLLIQVVAWLILFRTDALHPLPLGFASAGVLITIVGITVVREAIRLASVNLDALATLHAQAAHVGGLPIFLLFFVLNAILIVVCIHLVKRGLRAAAAE